MMRKNRIAVATRFFLFLFKAKLTWQKGPFLYVA
jgi:hypothetical protein